MGNERGMVDKSCVKCGARDRYSSGDCRPCRHAYSAANKERVAATNKAWREDNPEYGKAWLAANIERKAATDKAWLAANADRKAETNRAWAAANKERIAANGRARHAANPEATWRRRTRSRAREAGVPSEPYTLQQVAARCCGLCGICDERVDLDLAYPHPKSRSVDHIIPLSGGGPDTLANAQLACLDCNAVKGSRVA